MWGASKSPLLLGIIHTQMWAVPFSTTWHHWVGYSHTVISGESEGIGNNHLLDKILVTLQQKLRDNSWWKFKMPHSTPIPKCHLFSLMKTIVAIPFLAIMCDSLKCRCIFPGVLAFRQRLQSVIVRSSDTRFRCVRRIFTCSCSSTKCLWSGAAPPKLIYKRAMLKGRATPWTPSPPRGN